LSLDVSRIQGVIWDLDNTLYRFTDEFYRACTVAAAQAAQELGISLSYEDTLRLAERSEQEYGYSMHGYVTDHGLSYASLHFPFHQKIDETVIDKIDGVKEALKHLKLPQVILTNASRCWAERVLNYTGMKELFPDDRIIPMEDVGFEPKARTARGFLKAKRLLSLDAENVLMVDDLDRNLIIPCDLGMQTAYIHHGDPIEELPGYIDAQYEGILDVVKVLMNKSR
jgi:pyrimidine 5'-nucleotidase